jgi:hypothetical protein
MNGLNKLERSIKLECNASKGQTLWFIGLFYKVTRKRINVNTTPQLEDSLLRAGGFIEAKTDCIAWANDIKQITR